MVLRKTTTCGSVFCASAWPSCAASRRIAPWSWLPLAADGVPTQTRLISLPSTAARVSVVTLTRPPAATFCISSTMPSSTTGVLPAAMSESLVGSMSTPITWWPSRARQASETAPT